MGESTLHHFETSLAVCFGILMVLATVINTTILVGLTYKHHKRRLRDYLLISMATCDLLRIMLSGPVEIMGLSKHSVATEIDFCPYVAFFVYMFEFTSITHLLFVTIDRYLCTCKPTLALELYLNTMTICKCIVISYANGFVWAVLPIVGLGEYGIQPGRIQCGLIPHHDVKSMVYISLVITVMYLAPFCVIFYCLWKIWLKTKETAANLVRYERSRDEDSQETFEYILKDKKHMHLVLCLTVSFICTWFVYDMTLFKDIFTETKSSAYVEVISTFIGQSSAAIIPFFTLLMYKDLQKSLIKIYKSSFRRQNTVEPSRDVNNDSTLAA